MKKEDIIPGFYTLSRISLAIVVVVIMHGCSGIKPTSTKSNKKYFETFYVGTEGTQYYIRPLLFQNDDSNETLLVDFTFRYKDEIKDSATVNFSVTSSNIYKTIDSLKISTNALNIKANKPELLYNEKGDEVFTSRFTTKIPLSEAKQLFNYDDWRWITYTKNHKITYTPHRKAQKAIIIIRDNVFVLM